MVTKSFGYRPSPRDWSNLFSKKKIQMETLYMIMVTESFGYRPSPQDWSNLFFQKVKIQKEFGFTDWDPLHGNGR